MRRRIQLIHNNKMAESILEISKYVALVLVQISLPIIFLKNTHA